MDWTENNILAITTRSVFFFDEEFKSPCERICKQLNIDLFPDYDGKSYRSFDLEKNRWVQKDLSDIQRIEGSTLMFASEIIKSFEEAPSNILFVFDRGHFKGLVHFTDYRRKIVYEDLYKNLFEFENNLRQLLTIRGFGREALIKYFEYKTQKCKQHADRYNKLKLKIEREQNNNPMELLFTKDLLEFCYSSFHKTEKPFNIVHCNKEAISQLRNIIMHNKDNVGLSSTMPHDLGKFKDKFFHQVQVFRETFNILNMEIEKHEVEERPNLNRMWLQHFKKLSDDALKSLFFDYQKHR